MKWPARKQVTRYVPRTIREIQQDMERASVRLKHTREPADRRTLLKEMKRLVLECQELSDAPALGAGGGSLTVRAAGVAGEPDKLALLALEKLLRKRCVVKDREA